MHYITMVAVDVEKCPEYDDEDEDIRAKIADLEKQKAALADKKDSAYIGISIGCNICYLKSIASPFARAVDGAVEIALEPFCEDPEDSEYLEFIDSTEDIRTRYETNRYDCIKLANGRIVLEYALQQFFCVKEGKVYQKNVGPLKLEKRTKRAKKMTALPNYPLKKMYKSFEECAEKFFGLEYDEEYGGYGYMRNPDSFWDWYRIGGRWPLAFLVKNDCIEFSEGNHDDGDLPAAPNGYKWACAARKKDIQWQALIRYKKECMERQYYEMREIFEKKVLPENDCWLKICDDGIYAYGGVALYINGETYEENQCRRGFITDSDYLEIPDYFVGNGEWQSEDTIPYVEGVSSRVAWIDALKEFYHKLSEEIVLVSVDTHN